MQSMDRGRMENRECGAGRSTGGVQSVARVFDLLETMADLGGIVTLSELAHRSGLPGPTIHRLVRTLVDLGYVRQEPSRAYALGPRLVRLGEGAGRLIGTWAMPHLRRLVDAVGESANLALLDGDEIVYTAQVPGLHAMRMFTEVGRHAGIHCTAVGKSMLASMPPDRATEILRRSELAARTVHTITTLEGMQDELSRIRETGYALDEEEQEVGVRCIAVTLPGEPARAAISVSGLSTRMTEALVGAAVPILLETARALGDELDLAGVAAAESGVNSRDPEKDAYQVHSRRVVNAPARPHGGEVTMAAPAQPSLDGPC
jgi:IclR family transcriptional regulator, acetate operon repressor